MSGLADNDSTDMSARRTCCLRGNYCKSFSVFVGGKNKDKTVIKYPLSDCSSATYPADADLIARGSGYGLKVLSKSSMTARRVPGIMLVL